MQLTELATIVGLLSSLLAVLSVLAKAISIISGFRAEIAHLEETIARLQLDHEHKLEKQLLTLNGIRERMEHINTRVSGELKRVIYATEMIESWLNKNTAYEKRSHLD